VNCKILGKKEKQWLFSSKKSKVKEKIMKKYKFLIFFCQLIFFVLFNLSHGKSDAMGCLQYYKHIEDIKKDQDAAEIMHSVWRMVRTSPSLRRLDLSENKLGDRNVQTLISEGLSGSSSILQSLGLSLVGISQRDTAMCLHRILSGTLNRSSSSMGDSKDENWSLRELDLSRNGWTRDAVDILLRIPREFSRIRDIKLTPSSQDRIAIKDHGKNKKSMDIPIELAQWEEDELKAILERNQVIGDIIEELVEAPFVRRFKTKLSAFRQSVKETRVKNKVADKLTPDSPAYKV